MEGDGRIEEVKHASGKRQHRNVDPPGRFVATWAKILECQAEKT
jgi:hypothetical protein